jgi:glycosyltransferase involved in cell wall biosynthesis
MRILFLSRWYPYPPIHGSKLRIYHLLTGLAQKHEITLLSFFEESDVPVNTKALETICREVHVVPWKPFNPGSLRARLGFSSLTPRSVIDTFSVDMKQCIAQILSAEDYDMVVASQIYMAVYGQYFHRLPAIFEEVESGWLYEHFAQAQSPWRRLRHGLTWAKHSRFLAALVKNFKLCTVVSDREYQILSRAVNGYQSIEVVPNCVELKNYLDIQESPQPDRLIFTGSISFMPNYEAMVWFLGEVYPHVQAQVPEVKLTITGDPARRHLPPAKNVTQTGFVNDVRPLIARAWGSLVPIHSGGGTRLKILEAMALGTPVVATSKGAEGLDVQPGQHLLIGDTPESYAREVVRLLKEPELRQYLVNNAAQLIREKYDWAVVMPRFLELVEQVATA